jgi:hypothetical protein
MGRRIYPIVLPRITGLVVDDRDGFELIRALIESNPRAAIVARHLHEPIPVAPPADPQVEAIAATLRAEAKPGEAARAVLSRARFTIAATREAAEAVLADDPGHVSALRVLAKCQARAGEHAAAAATLRALMRRGPVGPETRRELRRLDLLAGPRPPDPAPPEEAVTLEPLAAAADAAMRAVADGGRPDRAGFAGLLRQAFEAALRDSAGALPPALMALRRARDVAIVGNGPSLKGSGAGAAIEAHGAVLRFNFPVLTGHEADVGRRTDAMILAGAKRGFLASLLEREPGYRRVPAMVAEHRPARGPADGKATPPPIPLPILRLVWQAGYGGPTSGFTGILLTVLLLNRPATLFGFDFFAPGQPGHYFGEAAAALQHETAFERWYVTRFLPAIRPGVRFHAVG